DAGREAAPRQSTLLAARSIRGDSHPLAQLRWQLQQALARSGAGRRDPPHDAGSGKPAPQRAAVRLHVAHSWGGGLGSWVRDFCEADSANQHLVLRSIGVTGAYGQRLALYLGKESAEPVRLWELALPIHVTALAHLQYRAILREIVDEFGVDGVLVSSLIGHSLDVLRTGLPTVVVTHDHHPFCVALFAYFDGECRQCDRSRLQSCIEGNPGHRFFRGASADDWMALRGAFCEAVLEHDLSLVAPSASAMGRWHALMPTLAGARWKVVAHGTSLPPAIGFTPPAEGKLRLIKLGRLSPEKGSDLLEELLPEIAEFAELTVLGCGDEAARIGRRPAVTALATFSREELPRLIAEARPHLGLQLSIVPETFGYTLSELWHCAVPVLACRVGSLADRVREGENGFLVEPDAKAIGRRLREIAAQRDALAQMRAGLRREAQPSCEEMVAQYAPLLPALGGRAGRLSQRRAWTLDQGRRGAHAPRVMASGRVALGPLSIDPQVTYVQAARAFLRFTLYKAMHSPRVPAIVRRLISGGRG
ncbi:MAG: glycosyltransferase, partial [Burkholderiaceae bacterium]|nr:glycosyltransferase [Burkholderiaceae bacterium]